jgi:lipopolysaccharide export LptBFGC system permease protein LptF
VRILRRYILSEVISHALIGGALFTFVLFMRDLGQILELVVRESASLASVGQIFLFTLPNTFSYTIPMAVLVGVLLGLSRLAADSEITAMRAAGIGVWRFVGIVSLFAVLAWGISLLTSLYLAPKAAEALLELENALKTSQASFEIQPRVFYEDFKNYVLYVQNVRPSTGASQWQRVFLADLTNPATSSSPTIPTSTPSPPSPKPTFRYRSAIRKTRISATRMPPCWPCRPQSYSGSPSTMTGAGIASSSTNALPFPHPASS